MGLNISGYVLEPPRVGASNSPFTLTPNDLISDQAAFDAAYPADESVPRSEYMVQVLEEVFTGPTGPGGNRSLPDARFGWTRNEGALQQGAQVPFQRFDYDGQAQRFRTLQGAPREALGAIEDDANANRLTAPVPQITDLVSFPIRLSVGDTGSGTTFTVTLVEDDASFGTPAAGTVELSRDSGNLNWASSDVTAFLGQAVYFQRQAFYLPADTTGYIGSVGDTLVLNPLPATGQIPLLSVGSREYITTVEVADDSSLGTPPAGTIHWSRETGLLRLSAADEAAYLGQPLAYDGVLLGTFQVPVDSFPSLGDPAAVASPIPDEESDAFFRIPGVVQFPNTRFVDSVSLPGKAGEVQIERVTGTIQFSASDIGKYGGTAFELVYPDVEIERGISLRLFRSPVDRGATDNSIKDVTATYTTDATLADPIIGQPLVFLPALPLLDHPLTVRVAQGSGSFTDPLNRLDTVPPPAAGKGYLIDFEARQLLYGERKVDEVIDPGLKDYGAFQLPNFPVFSSNFTLEQETSPGSNAYTTLTPGNDFQLDTGSGTVTFTATDGTLELESSGGSIASASELQDSIDFVAAGVLSGDFLVVTAGPNEGVYVISGVSTPTLEIEETFPDTTPGVPVQYEVRRGVEVLVDRYWREVPRLDPNTSVTRINGGTPTVLELGVDYEIQPGTGFIEFTERMLEDEEVLVSYAYFADDGTKVSVVDERGAFLVSKEVVQPHPTPTSVLSFNPEGKEVASNPGPMAWRGGRPQSPGDQVIFDTTNSTVTFLEDGIATDALPHGQVVSPSENVYVDYYIYGALGGEKNLTVLNTPMASVQIVIEEGDTSFKIEGNRLADFPANHLLRVDGQEIYQLGSPSFDGTETTVTLDQGVPQAFKSDFSNPTLEVTSGPTLRVASGTTPSYFTAEGSTYDPLPRGSKRVRIEGDHTRTYTGGAVILFSDGSFQDYVSVEGSSYDDDTDRTEVVLSGGTQTQYTLPVTLYRSVRPVLATPSARANTTRSPILDLGVTVFRRQPSQPGAILTQGEGYTIDDAGVVQLVDPLQLNEEIGIFYTGYQLVAGGTKHRASWNFVVVPNQENGLANQVLKMEYTTYIPDTFFFRVETLTNFRGELAEQFSEQAKANSPSQGPTLENSAGQQLYEKGNKSLFFDEGRFANEDIVARVTLCFYNDAINYLEDYLQAADGRVVGDRDGRFLFDGSVTNFPRTDYSQVTNQIDDTLLLFQSSYPKVSPLFSKIYQHSSESRFFPTKRRTSGRVETTPTETGDIVYSTGYTPLFTLESPAKRFPFALITQFTPSGSDTLVVDEANGNEEEFFRPPFETGMVITIIGQDGTVLDATGLTVSSITDNDPNDDTVVLSGGVATDIPAGSTLRLSEDDGTYPQSYAVGISVNPVLNEGLVAYVVTGSILPFSSPPPIPQGGDYWDVTIGTLRNEPEPYRFPALDGLTTDDDGTIQTNPLLSPQANSELALGSGSGYASREVDLLADILANTSTPTSLVGSLDAAGTTLTLDSGTFAITPRAGDLVKITTGANAGSTWVRVLGGTATTATLESFYSQDSGFTFYITNTASVATGSGGTVSVSGTTFTDTAANFTASVVPGHTLVISSDANSGQRRNVAAVVSATELTLSSAFTSSAESSFSYRVDNYLSTFGQTTASSFALWVQVLQGLAPVYTDEIEALEGYIDTVGEDIVVSAAGTTNGPELTDLTADFSDVSTQDIVFVRTGPNFGFYEIEDVSSTTLEVTPDFPAALGGMSYRVLRVTGTSSEGLAHIQEALKHSDDAQGSQAALLAAYGVETVYGDAGAYAHSLLESDLTARASQASGRETEVASDIDNISAVMSSIDRLYDVRFTWIDGRINLTNGILVQQERAKERRVENLAQVVKDLTKLLTAG